jgi:hypothetical protein
VQKVLAPSLKEGQIALMDNLRAHRPQRVRELIEQREAKLLYLPSYSPEYNPIEEAFAKVKNLLGSAAARTKGSLVEAIGVALSEGSAQDARGYCSGLLRACRIPFTSSPTVKRAVRRLSACADRWVANVSTDNEEPI